MGVAQPWVHGPGHIFCGVGDNKAPVYLGTAETTPRIELRPEVVAYFNSIYSPSIPLDWDDVGEQAYVFCDINKWNEADVMSRIMSRPRFAGQRGLHSAGDLGTLVTFENWSYPIWIQFPYSAAKAAYGDMPGGYHFLSSRLVGPDVLEPISMAPAKRRLIWHCLELISLGVNNTTISQLYDFDMSGLPTIDFVY